jgi:Zn-dependent protease
MLFLGLVNVMWMIYLIIALLISLSVHEASHAWVAAKLGDTTAKDKGRLTLNPFAHLEPFGTLLLLTVGLGWGRPVPVDPFRLRPNPKVGMALVGMAGPISNLLLALVVAIPLRLHWVRFTPQRVAGVLVSSGELLSFIVWLSLALAVFNLIPFGPLDGSRIVAGVLPDWWFYLSARLELVAFGLFILVLLADRFLGTSILARAILPPVQFLWWKLVGFTPPDLFRF